MDLSFRKPLRLKDFDYTAGWYFVTACAFDRQELFGKISDDATRLSREGEILREQWLKTGEIRQDVSLDAFVVMPNHFHAVLSLSGARVDQRSTPTSKQTLGSVMKLFKSATTKQIHRELGRKDVWQRYYYDHVVRDEADLYRIREYIQNNPLKWQLDRENPACSGNNADEDRWFV